MNCKPKSFCYPGIIILCLFVSIHSDAQNTAGNFTQYTERDGLPGVEVTDLLVDKQGYIWLGTVNGLARYDGYTFKRFYFNPNDSNTIHGLTVWSLFQDRKGQIWVGTGPSYLNMYNPITQKFVQYKFAHLVPHRTNTEIGITDIAEDDNGRMYFGVDTYYYDSINTPLLYKEMNEDVLKPLPIPDSLRISNIYRLKKDQGGNIWIFSYSGIFKIDKKGDLSRFRLIEEELLQNKDYPGDIGFDSLGHIWIISQKLYLYEINISTSSYKQWNDKVDKTPENEYWARSLIIDKKNNILVGAPAGLLRFDRNTGQFENFSGDIKELEGSFIRDLKFDNFGTLWIGTNAAGMIKYEERPLLRSYSYNKDDKNPFTSGWANNIYRASDGKIWITTSGSSKTSGINIIDTRNNNIRSIPFPKINNRMNGVASIWESKPGEMYISGYGAVFRFSEKTLELDPVQIPGLPDQVLINSYLKDNSENEWLFTFSGVYKKQKDANEYKQYDLSKVTGGNTASNEVTRGFESKKHGLWILTNNGLFLYNYSTDKIERHAYDQQAGDILITQDVNSLYESADGIVWIGTWQGGLSEYNAETKKLKNYTRNDGLPSMSIQGILADEKNNALWLSTFDGLSRFNLTTRQFNNFTIADGIQGQLFADGSYLKTPDGLFIFGGANGITMFHADEVNKNSIPPKVFLTDLKIFDKSVIPGENSVLKKAIYETDEITLAHNQNSLSIEFLALHYSNAAQNKYSYKLENFDEQWRDVANQRVAFYSKLPPGKYIFHVKAANDKGVWNEKGAALTIIIDPPWWKTTAAYISYGLLLIMIGFAVDRYVRRRLVMKEREKNRARELEQAKEIEKAYYKLEEAHEALKATQSQLIHSEKMASLGELTAGIAHEIQNPLNFVNNFSEVNAELIEELKPEVEKGNKQQAVVIADSLQENEQKIIYHGKRAEAIVKNMLQHSRVSSGQKDLTDINALADEYLRLAYHGLRAKDKSFNAKFETNFDNSIEKVNIVPQDIGRVVLNLINNAFYAVSEKAKQNIAGYEPVISVNTKKLNGKLELRVRDNGNGIPDSIKGKIFQPFFTTKPTGQGTGLGLSLSYDIVKAHGGELKVETDEGQGSEFSISLPLR